MKERLGGGALFEFPHTLCDHSSFVASHARFCALLKSIPELSNVSSKRGPYSERSFSIDSPADSNALGIRRHQRCRPSRILDNCAESTRTRTCLDAAGSLILRCAAGSFPDGERKLILDWHRLFDVLVCKI